MCICTLLYHTFSMPAPRCFGWCLVWQMAFHFSFLSEGPVCCLPHSCATYFLFLSWCWLVFLHAPPLQGRLLCSWASPLDAIPEFSPNLSILHSLVILFHDEFSQVFHHGLLSWRSSAIILTVDANSPRAWSADTTNFPCLDEIHQM